MEQVKEVLKYIVDPHQVRSPTLLIGIGGIGGQIVKGVYDAMSDYDRTYVEMLVMDTNTNDLDKFKDTGIRYIQTSENQTVQSYLEANEEYAEGFPVNPLINGKNLSDGAGQIRAVSRLGALASKAEGKFAAIDDAIDRILTNHGDTLQRAVRVMIVGSSTGGTGSGLGVQLPFYVRNVLKRKSVPAALVRGLFLMPSLTEGEQETEASAKAVNVNGYAFLKELNAFYRMQLVDAEDNPLVLEEYVPGVKSATTGGKTLAAAGAIPYDFLFLVEKYGKRGSIGELEDYIARSVQIVMNQLFSPVSGAGFSKEDNLIISAVEKGGMNRYCGAGISHAIYPKDEVVRYCTVRYAGELIKGYWLQIDDEFRRRDEQQRRLRKANPNLSSLDRGETYCQIFDDMCDPKKHTITGELTSLQSELKVNVIREVGNEKISEPQPLTDCLVNYIEGHIDEVFAASGLQADSAACGMNTTLLKIPTQAEGEISAKMNLLTNFRQKADTTVSNLIGAVAEDILPSDLKLAQGISKDARHNLFVSLQEKHPIAARYVLYSLRTRLRQKKQDSDQRLEERYNRESIFTKDYFREGGRDTHNETPIEAIRKVRPGFLSSLGLTNAAYSKLVRTIANDASAEAAHLLDMAEHTLKSTVYRIVLERLDVMIELYEKFFEELRNIMKAKEEETERLETGKGAEGSGDFKGDKYICCNAACKKALYDEFQKNITQADREMSAEVKQGFFEKMFGEYAVQLEKKERDSIYVTSMSLPQLFEQGVLQPIAAQFMNRGFKHLDMSVLEAVKKQYEIENMRKVTDRNDPEYRQYFNKLCKSLQILADPYLAYNREVAGYVSGGKLAYTWGLNHSSVAIYQSGTTDQGVDNAVLSDMFAGCENSTPLADESFSPYTMVCYATVYDLRIENCSAYKKGERAQSCYAERLRNVVDQTFVISDEQDGYLEVVHPHLDCRWHERAYLPELMEYDDKKMRNDTRVSFIAALCMGMCAYWEEKSEGLKCWWYRRADAKHSTPVFVNDRELRSESAFALYKAFDCNRILVEDAQKVLEEAKKEAYQERPLAGVTAESVVAQPVIQALIGNGKGKRNVLDILYNLMQDSGSRKEFSDTLAALESYLQEYCLKMANDNANKAGVFFDAVRKAIGGASAALQSDDTSKIFKESCEEYQ